MSEPNDDTTAAEHAFAEAVFQRLAAAAEPILKRKLSDFGIVDFKTLGRDERARLFRESMLEAAALTNPMADFDMLRRSITAMTNDRFSRALAACRSDLSAKFGAFDPVQGREAGILLAGFGLPVMPLDRKTMSPLGAAASTIEGADEIFSRAKTAFVGYTPAQAPFHLMVTDCINTLQSMIIAHPAFAGIRSIMERDGRGLPKKSAPPFKHACLLVAKTAEDQVESYLHMDPSPNRGSAILVSGWMEDGIPSGTFANGVFFVPKQLLAEILDNPQLIGWLNQPTGLHLATMH